MDGIFERTRLIFGDGGMEKLKNSHIAVFGAGGVGGYAIEAFARSGIGAIDITDPDLISLSNVNRQIFATQSSVGKYKAEVAKARIYDINPECRVEVYKVFFLPENADGFDFSKYDYVIDAIDTVAGKLAIIERAYNANVPVISAMGAGNKVNPAMFEVGDVSKTSVCPLARVMRRELKKRGIERLKVVYSKEEPLKCGVKVPASNSFTPPVAGFILAGEVIKSLAGYCG